MTTPVNLAVKLKPQAYKQSVESAGIETANENILNFVGNKKC